MKLVLVGSAILLVGLGLATPAGQRLLNRLLAPEPAKYSIRQRITLPLLIALWFGLAAGLIEGGGQLLLQKLWTWQASLILPIVWVSAFFYVLLFGAMGLALMAIGFLLPRFPVVTLSVFLFALLMFRSWLSPEFPWGIESYALWIMAIGLALTLSRWFYKHPQGALRFLRRSLPILVAAAVLAFLGIQGGSWLKERLAVAGLPPSAPDAPNIMVIVVDTLRADHLSSYGYLRPTSPNIDHLAQQGVLFESAFSTAPWTAPSHASLLTGRYPYEHQAFWIGEELPYLDDTYPVLPEALQEQGYRTAAFSANTHWFTRRVGFGRGFMRFEDFFHSPVEAAMRTYYGRNILFYILPRLPNYQGDPLRKWAPDVNRSVLHWLDHDPEKPFFVFLNYFDVHDPYVSPQPYRSQFSKLQNPGGRLNSDLPFTTSSAEQLQGEIDAYDGAIVYVDHQISQLLAEIQRRGLGNNLLVFLTSDHGEAFGEHGVFLHAHSVYREEIHVPLILWWPGHLPAGLRISQPVTNAALPATIMDLLDLDDQTMFPGTSLAQLWEAPQEHPDWPMPLAEMEHRAWRVDDSPSRHGAMKSLVSPQWHYIDHEAFGIEVYDWQKDSQELNNLAETPEGQSIIDWFGKFLNTGFASRPLPE
jgi:arylsulfatase A-like enzyme